METPKLLLFEAGLSALPVTVCICGVDTVRLLLSVRLTACLCVVFICQSFRVYKTILSII